MTEANLLKAEKITKDIYVDDIPFIAFHLQYKHKIWSLDKKLISGLTEKGYGHFFISTNEVRKYLYKKKS
nr:MULTISPECIES: PIN domain-containing protein [unclassified Capnocytophaga]